MRSKVTRVLHFSAPVRENYYAPHIRIHQIYLGTRVRDRELEVIPFRPVSDIRKRLIGRVLLHVRGRAYGIDFAMSLKRILRLLGEPGKS